MGCKYRVWDNGDFCECGKTIVAASYCQEHISKPDQDTGWIYVNLPWNITVDIPNPNYPSNTIDKQVKLRFGYTRKELRKNFVEKHGCAFEEFLFKVEQIYYSAGKTEAEVEDLLEKSNDSQFVIIREFQDKNEQINSFIESLPEYIEYDTKLEQVEAERERISTTSCFNLSPLNRPGILIEVQDTNLQDDGTTYPIQQYLIGHINTTGSDCYCDKPFADYSIVLRAKIIYTDNYNET